MGKKYNLVFRSGGGFFNYIIILNEEGKGVVLEVCRLWVVWVSLGWSN